MAFFPAYQASGKPSIKQNRWDNWYGYIGRKKVVFFFNTTTQTQQQQAEEWLAARLQEMKQ